VSVAIVLGDGEAGRLDVVLATRYPGVGRRRWTALFADGAVEVDGARARKGDRVGPGARVVLREEPAAGDELAPVPEPDRPLSILAERPDLVAIDKPAGWPSHPLRAGETGTVANALVARFPGCAGAGRDPREGGLVHRLDRGTSGVLIAARDREAWESLRRAFAGGEVHKRYLAVAVGPIDDGGCDLPLRAAGKRAMTARRTDRGALPAETTWRVVARTEMAALVEATATTGRMHQVRAHLAACGAPLLGDPLYGGPERLEVGGDAIEVALPFLHAASVELPRPGERLAVAAPMPADRAALLARLGLAG
jgi:23S rRNA pseudouridine1911/1915/1917 synthase